MIRRFFTSLLVTACLSSFLQAVTKNKPFQIYEFSKGLDSYHNSTTLPDGFVQDSNNVLFDEKSPVQKRQGYTVAWSTKNYSYTQLWSYTDQTNTTWQIARSSDQITASNLAGSVVKIATVSISNLVGETNAFGNAYFVDQTQGVYYWNATSTTYVSGSPTGSIITQFHNRLWVTGASVPNGNQLYASGYYAGNTWTTGPNPTDPAQYSIGLQDNFDNVTAEYVYLDTLYLFKHYSIFALYGFDQTSFQISQLTQECGCIDGNSIQTYNQGMEFVSLRGVEKFNGYSCTRISDPVKNKVDPAIQVGGFSQQSWIQQSLTDWASGSFSSNNNLSTTTAASPALQWVGAGKETTSSDFNSDALTGLSWNSLGIQISTDVANIVNNSFENGSAGWTYLSGLSPQSSNTDATHCFGTGPKDGSKLIEYVPTATTTYPINVDFRVQHCGDNSLLGHAVISTSYQGSCSWIQGTIPLSLDRLCAYITVQDPTNSNTLMTSSDFLTNGNSMTFYYIPDQAGGGGSGGSDLSVDFFQNGRTDNENNFLTSKSFNTYKTSSTIVPMISWTISGSTPSFVLQSSTNSIGWSNVGTSTGVPYSVNQYVRYLSTWTFSPNLDFKSSLQSVDLQPFIFVSTWTSSCHSIGAINSWGNLLVSEDLSGGALTAFTVCSSANSSCTSAKCAAILPNSQITVSTNSYVQIIDTFTAIVTTQTAIINSEGVQWFTGSAQIPMASTVWDNRYWLSLTTNTADTANDAVLVLNQSGAWASLDIHAGAFTQYKNSLYHADSNATGNIYLDNQGWADNGAPINAYVRTKTLGFGDLASDDYLYTMYPAALNTGNCTMTVQYVTDKSSTLYSLGSPLLNEFSSFSSVRLPFPIDSSHQDFAQSIDFIFGTDDNQCDWQFEGFEGLFKSRPVN